MFTSTVSYGMLQEQKVTTGSNKDCSLSEAEDDEFKVYPNLEVSFVLKHSKERFLSITITDGGAVLSPLPLHACKLQSMSFEKNAAIQQKNRNVLQNVEAYDAIADSYDEDSKVIGYNAPLRVAEIVKEYCSMSKDTAQIMDMACGTGLVGVELSKFGFSNIDGFDGGENMLKYAAKKNVYRGTYYGFLSEKLKVSEDGFIVIAVRREYYYNDEYRRTFRATMKALEEEGKIRRIVENIFPDYLSNLEGVMLLLQKSF